ncbi:MAG: DUF4476 domain-containing protein [Bacteroidetes bacterium]|nr:DUF4476 domain-containing protein [Bacteroidota bacterium]
MKNSILLLISFLSVVFAVGQTNNLTVFSENGERFYVSINGINQNLLAEGTLKITGLTQPTYNVKIVFENRNISSIEAPVYFEWGGNRILNNDFVYSIRKTNMGTYQMQYIYNAPTPVSQPLIIVEQQQTTTTTITQSTISTSDPIMMGVNINGMGADVSINTGATQSVTTTQTTIAQTDAGSNQTAMSPSPTNASCPNAMNSNDFAAAKKSISSKSFEDSKLTVAKQLTSRNCLSSLQVKEIVELFSYENTKLQYAKFAYRYTVDRGKYFLVNDAFQYESSITDLNNFLGTLR